MASYVNNLRLLEIAQGAESGTWGTKTNLNLELIGEALGFGTEAITDNANTHDTTVADGAADQGRPIYLIYTGALDSDCTITISPNDMKRVHIIKNNTTDSGSSGPYNILIKQGSGGGAAVTIPNGDTKVVSLNGGGSGAIVTDVFDSLSVVDLKVQDDLTVTDDVAIGGLATVAGALTVSGLTTANAKLDLNGTELILDADADTSITADTDDQIDVRIAGADDFTFTANTFTALSGSGVVIPDGGLTLGSTAITSTATELNQLDGTVAKTAGKESIWVPAGAMYPSTTNGCGTLTQVETTALRPDLKVLDFAAAADDFAQFSVAFPKSWNEGTITYQPFWTVTGTNTGTVVWQLGGIAVTSDATINTAFGTLIATTALAHSGTSNDLMVSAESGAVTIAGSPSTDDVCFFQINNDTSASGQTGVVRLLGIKIFFTTDAANDA
mgnify:CR=1 FL=1|tara:strand:+ start:6113 stop:7441 length:1329 start_codon:yes stop_codon:yes gene_type:complete